MAVGYTMLTQTFAHYSPVMSSDPAVLGLPTSLKLLENSPRTLSAQVLQFRQLVGSKLLEQNFFPNSSKNLYNFFSTHIIYQIIIKLYFCDQHYLLYSLFIPELSHDSGIINTARPWTPKLSPKVCLINTLLP